MFTDQATDSLKTSLPFRREEIEASIPQRFEYVVDCYAESIAVKHDNAALSYRELDNASNRLARAIGEWQGEISAPIALLLDHDSFAIIAMLGVLKAGKCYVVLDPSVPEARLQDILEHAQAELLICQAHRIPLAQSLTEQRHQLRTMEEIESGFSSEMIDVAVSPDTLATILYTSGSTGQPKGVVHTHRSILHYIAGYTNTFQLCRGDGLLGLSAFHMTAGMTDIFRVILTGATLYPFTVQDEGLSRLAARLAQEDISIFHVVPTLFRRVMSLLKEKDAFPHIRLVHLGGEPMLGRDVELYHRHFSSQSVLLNNLGSSETFSYRQYAIDRNSSFSEDAIPVGFAVADKDVVLLNERGQTVELDCIGEIAIKSRYLAVGYWKNPKLTRQKFLPDPEGGDKRIYLTGDLGRMRPDGCLEYLGRKDFQVKIRGNRVELAEIEAVLYQIVSVKEAVVTAHGYESGDTELIAYIVSASRPAPSGDELRREVAELLPEYMLPSRCIFLETFPLTPSGKIDRQALPEPEHTRPLLDTPYMAPRTDLEQRIQAVCEDLLGIHPIGAEDNLFDLGMHSIQALRLLVELEKLHEQKLPPDVIIQASTIGELGGRLMPQSPSCASGQVSKRARKRARKNFKKPSRLKQAFRRWPVPYPVGITFLFWLFGTWVNRTYLFQEQIQHLSQFLAEIGPSPDEVDSIRQYLVINMMKGWLSDALVRCPPRQYAKWVRVIEESTLQQDDVNRRGILLIGSHFGPPGILSFLQLEFRRFTEIAPLVGRKARIEQTAAEMGQSFLKREYLPIFDDSQRISSVYQARQILERQGIVYIVADGYKGKSSLALPFLGRLRPFRTGFAELAVQTGAAVIPMFPSLDGQGRITVKFLNPLEPGGDTLSEQEQIERLITQYASLLEDRWLNAPGNIRYSQINQFLRLPRID
ncbi:MAG: amino acid adenylation domain-containing protein [bacterium]|nr:amino acid adenylation domain-containing protein [bacterium]